MDALNPLTTRRSSKKLVAPAPNAKQLEQMLQAAIQASDHGNIRPYRFTVIQSETGLQRFRELSSRTVIELNFSDDAMKKTERVGSMAPMIIGAIFTPSHEMAKLKPEWEQMLTAGCAAYALQLTASAQGFDNVWVTGMWINGPLLREAFECTGKDKIIGLMMISPSTEEGGGPKNTNPECFTAYWQSLKVPRPSENLI